MNKDGSDHGPSWLPNCKTQMLFVKKKKRKKDPSTGKGVDC